MISETDKARLKVGFKEVLKVLSEGRAEKVFLAKDCEDKIKNPVEEQAKLCACSVFYVDTMKELGALCGIHVKASCAVLVKN